MEPPPAPPPAPGDRRQLAERGLRGRPRRRPGEDAVRPGRPGGERGDQPPGGRREGIEPAPHQGVGQGPEGTGLVRGGGEAPREGPLDAPGDPPLVAQECLEARPGEPPHGEVGLGHHGRRPGLPREQRDLAERLPRPEGVEPLLDAVVAAGHDHDAAVLDDVEAVGRVALADHGLAGLEPELLQLTREPRQIEAPELGEQRRPSQRRRRVGADLVWHARSGALSREAGQRDGSAPACRRRSRSGCRGRRGRRRCR